MKASTPVRWPLPLTLSLALLVGGGLAGNVGCGNNPSGTGAAGRGGGGGVGLTGGGLAGGAGTGTADDGGGGAGTGGCFQSEGGNPGAGGTQMPQPTDLDLLNAPTTGGIVVTRTPPDGGYPICQ